MLLYIKVCAIASITVHECLLRRIRVCAIVGVAVYECVCYYTQKCALLHALLCMSVCITRCGCHWHCCAHVWHHVCDCARAEVARAVFLAQSLIQSECFACEECKKICKDFLHRYFTGPVSPLAALLQSQGREIGPFFMASPDSAAM